MININQIREFVEKNPGLVTRKESIRYPGLFVIKYKRKVFYDNLWTPELQELRGLVVDEDWNIVVLPFTKIFNHGENGTTLPLDEEVTSVRKVNGFMAAMTKVDGVKVISTTGSMDSDFVALAEHYLKDIGAFDGMTLLYEICHPQDPHIIPEIPGAYLIGARHNATGRMEDESVLDDISADLSVRETIFRPEWDVMTFREVVQGVKHCRHEGFIVHGNELSLKIKSPYYLVSKFLARKGGEKLVAMIEEGQSLRQIIQNIGEEEYFPLLEQIIKDKDIFVALDEYGRLRYISNFFGGVQTA